MSKYVNRPVRRGDLVEYIGCEGGLKPGENDYGVVVSLTASGHLKAEWWIEQIIMRAPTNTVRILDEEFHTLFALAHPDIYEWLLQHKPQAEEDE